VKRVVMDDGDDLGQRTSAARNNDRRCVRKRKIDRSGAVRGSRGRRSFSLDDRHIETGVFPGGFVEGSKERRVFAVGGEVQEEIDLLQRTGSLSLSEAQRHRTGSDNGDEDLNACKAPTESA